MVGHRKAPNAPSLDAAPPNSQAAAGGLLMKIAMSRPTAREAWQDAVVEYQQGETLSRRLAAAEWSRIEAEKINAAIRGAPPLEETEWQPPSPNRVVGARGKNDSEIRERWRQRLDEEIKRLEMLKKAEAERMERLDRCVADSCSRCVKRLTLLSFSYDVTLFIWSSNMLNFYHYCYYCMFHMAC